MIRSRVFIKQLQNHFSMFLTKGNCQGDDKQNWRNNHFQNQQIPILASNKTSTTAARYSYLAVHI